MKNKILLIILPITFLAYGCYTYRAAPIPIRPASSYALQARPRPLNRPSPPVRPPLRHPPVSQPPVTQLPLATGTIVQPVAQELTIGAEVLSDPGRCMQYFGVDLNRAGVLPVMLVYTNNSSHFFNIRGSQIFAIDSAGNMWSPLTIEQTIQRVGGSSAGQDLLRGAGTGALIGGAGGAALGAVIGSFSGHAAEGAMIGAAAGGISGSAIGAAQESERMAQVIRRDILTKTLKDQQLLPGTTVSGFIFFPGNRYNRIEINTFNTTTQQSLQYAITPQASF